MGLLARLFGSGAKWECDQCGELHRSNPSECSSCGHTVLTKHRE